MFFLTVKKSCVMAVLAVVTLILPTFANAELSNNSAIVSPANRQTPSDESIDKLLEIQHYKKSKSELAEIMQPAILEVAKNGAIEIGKIQHLTPNQTQQVQLAYTKSLQEMVQEDYFNTLQADQINILKTTIKAIYTQQEVDAMIAFYSSPIGQQIQSKQPQFATIYTQKLMSIMQNLQQDIIKKTLPKLLLEVERIKHQVPN